MLTVTTIPSKQSPAEWSNLNTNVNIVCSLLQFHQPYQFFRKMKFNDKCVNSDSGFSYYVRGCRISGSLSLLLRRNKPCVLYACMKASSILINVPQPDPEHVLPYSIHPCLLHDSQGEHRAIVEDKVHVPVCILYTCFSSFYTSTFIINCTHIE